MGEIGPQITLTPNTTYTTYNDDFMMKISVK